MLANRLKSERLAGEKRKLEIAESEVAAKQEEMDKKRRRLSVARATAKKSKTYELLESWKVKSPLEHGSTVIPTALEETAELKEIAAKNNSLLKLI